MDPPPRARSPPSIWPPTRPRHGTLVARLAGRRPTTVPTTMGGLRGWRLTTGRATPSGRQWMPTAVFLRVTVTFYRGGSALSRRRSGVRVPLGSPAIRHKGGGGPRHGPPPPLGPEFGRATSGSAST